MIKIALAQHDFLVGDIEGNLASSKNLVRQAKEQGVDLLVFPEMALAGYPPEDLLLRPGFQRAAMEAVDELARGVHGIDLLMGHPYSDNGQRFNTASWIRNGELIGRYHKQCLPNYAVFDAHRYFRAGREPVVIALKG